MALVIQQKHYGWSYSNEFGYLSCWINDDFWRFGGITFQYLVVILHCIFIIYICWKKKKYSNTQSLKYYHRNISKNYFKFITIYVILWIPYMAFGIWILSTGQKKAPLWVIVFTLAFLISSGTANAILWNSNRIASPAAIKLIGTNHGTKSIPVLNKNQKRIGINTSKMITCTQANTKIKTSSLPLDYDPASKIGPRSMYNGDDDTPSMMLIDNTVNEYKYDITSTIVTPDGQHQTGLF